MHFTFWPSGLTPGPKFTKIGDDLLPTLPNFIALRQPTVEISVVKICISTKEEQLVLQQEAYPAIRPPIDAQNSAIPGVIDLNDRPLEPSFISEYLTHRSYAPV